MGVLTLVDVYSDEMKALDTQGRIEALCAWQRLRLRPGYAYPSSEIACKLGFRVEGCWFVESMNVEKHGYAKVTVGYRTKSEAYQAAGVREGERV